MKCDRKLEWVGVKPTIQALVCVNGRCPNYERCCYSKGGAKVLQNRER